MGLVQGFKGMILPTGVSLSANTASVGNGATYQLEAYITPELATNNKIHRSASNNNVTVDENGLVTGATDGTSVVTATTDYGGYTASCTFTVFTVPVTGVTLNESELVMSAGETFQLEAIITPSNATNKRVTWRSTDSSIAVVDSNGLVACIDDGEASIIVTTADGNYTASCDIAPGIPKEYQEVEWISSSSGTCIDTGLKATNNTVAQIKLTPLIVTGGKLLGANGTTDNDDWRIFNYNSQIYSDCNSARVIGSTFSVNNLYEFEIGNNYVKNVGASSNILTGTTQGTFTSPYNIEIYEGATWYYVKIYENGELVRDFIPCYRKSDGEIGMWDKVGRQFYTNSSSGSFTKGKDINVRLSDYDELEYIQSTSSGAGTSSSGQYIDTQIKPTNNTKVEFKLGNWTNTGASSNTIFGEDISWQNSGFSLIAGYYSFGNSGLTYSHNFNDLNIHTGEFSQAGLYKDGVLLTTPGTYTFTGVNLYLFALNRNGVVQEHATGKIYYLKIYESGELMRDFMPAKRKCDGVIGMLDKVNMVFYTNDGTGEFTAGPKLGVSLDVNSISLTEAGQTYQLTATPNPSSVGAQGYQWRSSDTTIATVSNTGLVTCVTPGECVITVTAVATGDTDTCSVKEETITEILLNFDDNNEVTNKGFTFGPYERNGVSASGGYMVVNGGSNDSGGSIIYDISGYNKWTFQARLYTQGTSWGGDQHVAVGDGDFGNNNLRYGYNPGHHLAMTTASGYIGNSGIGTGTSQGNEYGTYFAGWYVYEIIYDNGTYTMTRYNDTSEVTESSTYTHRKTYTGLGKAGNVGIWIRYGFSSENYNKADWAKLIYYS